MDELFPDQHAELVRCKDCQFSNPVCGQWVCIAQQTRDKRYKHGYVKVYPTKKHYCRIFKRI